MNLSTEEVENSWSKCREIEEVKVTCHVVMTFVSVSIHFFAYYIW